MTRDEILTMKPGPELNGLVARHVMGYEVVEVLPQGITYMQGKRKRWVPNSNYSKDIAAMWLVREELCESGGVELLNMCEEHPQCCIFTTSAPGLPLDRLQVITVMADTMPEAICKVALLAELDALSPFDIQAETCQGWLYIKEAKKP
jgi:hypothetical protein